MRPFLTIEERVARGRLQNSTADSGIVPFPTETNFCVPFGMMRKADAGWLASLLNDGYRLTPHVYRLDDRVPIFAVLRLDHAQRRKEFRPLRCERLVGSMPQASMRHLEGARPLYNLDKLASRPRDPVLVVEGEKAADGAERIFPDYVSTTWPGGAQSVGTADLLPLVDREVTIWPDNDAEGIKAAQKLAARLLRMRA
jgi:hypothetical protein